MARQHELLSPFLDGDSNERLPMSACLPCSQEKCTYVNCGCYCHLVVAPVWFQDSAVVAPPFKADPVRFTKQVERTRKHMAEMEEKRKLEEAEGPSALFEVGMEICDRLVAALQRIEELEKEVAIPCVTSTSPTTLPTCMYLKDGTKVIVCRKGKSIWLEHRPQAVLRDQAKKGLPSFVTRALVCNACGWDMKKWQMEDGDAGGMRCSNVGCDGVKRR